MKGRINERWKNAEIFLVLELGIGMIKREEAIPADKTV